MTGAASGLPNAGDVLAGKYQIERLIGQGGMGAVFAAEHLVLRQTVALKLLLHADRSDPQAINRFLNEARAAARIRGDNVARVLDVATLDDGRPFIVLEYLEGSDLSQVLARQGSLPASDVVEYLLQAASALEQAHAMGIVHRDLKPANLFLTHTHRGAPLIKVLDFGVAKAIASSGKSITTTDAVIGSPGYMAPEQLRGSKTVDARADIWAFGVIAYELLTGELPFSGDNMVALFATIHETVPTSIRKFVPEIPDAIEAAVMRCLRPNPNERFANVAELVSSIGSLRPIATPSAYASARSVDERVSSRPPRALPPDTTDSDADTVPAIHGMIPADASPSPSPRARVREPQNPQDPRVVPSTAPWATVPGRRPRPSRTWLAAGAIAAVFVAVLGVWRTNARREPPAQPVVAVEASRLETSRIEMPNPPVVAPVIAEPPLTIAPDAAVPKIEPIDAGARASSPSPRPVKKVPAPVTTPAPADTLFNRY